MKMLPPALFVSAVQRIFRLRPPWHNAKPASRELEYTLRECEGLIPERQTLIHSGGEKPCGGIAFYYYGPLEGKILTENALLLDGTVPTLHARMICGTCKFPFTKRTDGGFIIGVTPLK